MGFIYVPHLRIQPYKVFGITMYAVEYVSPTTWLPEYIFNSNQQYSWHFLEHEAKQGYKEVLEDD